MLIGAIVIISLALLILGHEAGHFFAAKFFGMKVNEFGIGFPPRIFARKMGETEYSVNWLPFGGFVKIAGEEERMLDGVEHLNALSPEEKQRFFLFQPAWKRSAVLLAGILMNVAVGWLLFSLVFMAGSPVAILVQDVRPGSPADQIGIVRGDAIEGFESAAAFTATMKAKGGEEISLSLRRGEESLTYRVTPLKDPKPGEGALGVLIAQVGVPKEPPLRALQSGLSMTASVGGDTVKAFYDVGKNLVSRGSVPEGVVGPVGMFSVAKSAGEEGLASFAWLIALISVNLAVLNLIPFPALDGGKFLLVLIEKMKGSPISRKIELWLNGLGFAALLLLMVLVTMRDVARL